MDCKPCRPYRHIPPFLGWVPDNATIPKLYWDTYSQEQRIHAMCDLIHRIACYADMLGIEVDKDHASIEALETEFQKFKESGFLDYYEQQLASWIAEHMPDIISASIRNVWFGLTMDGYFVAYIPQNGWDEIVFDTGAVYGSEEYGRLILMFNVDNANPVEPDIGEYHSDFAILNDHVQQLDIDVNALTETVEGFEPTVNDLELRVSRNETTLYTPITQSEEVGNNG